MIFSTTQTYGLVRCNMHWPEVIPPHLSTAVSVLLIRNILKKVWTALQPIQPWRLLPIRRLLSSIMIIIHHLTSHILLKSSSSNWRLLASEDYFKISLSTLPTQRKTTSDYSSSCSTTFLMKSSWSKTKTVFSTPKEEEDYLSKI